MFKVIRKLVRSSLRSEEPAGSEWTKKSDIKLIRYHQGDEPFMWKCPKCFELNFLLKSRSTHTCKKCDFEWQYHGS